MTKCDGCMFNQQEGMNQICTINGECAENKEE